LIEGNKKNKKRNKKNKKRNKKKSKRGRRGGDDTRKETTLSRSPMRTVQKRSGLGGAELDDGQRGQLMTEIEHDMI